MELEELYSLKDGHAYIVEQFGAVVSFGTMKKHVQREDPHIVPIRIGNNKRSRSHVFTRRMLDSYGRGSRSVKPTDTELFAVLGIDEAMRVTKQNPWYTKKYPYKTIGGASVFLRDDLLAGRNQVCTGCGQHFNPASFVKTMDELDNVCTYCYIQRRNGEQAQRAGLT